MENLYQYVYAFIHMKGRRNGNIRNTSTLCLIPFISRCILISLHFGNSFKAEVPGIGLPDASWTHQQYPDEL